MRAVALVVSGIGFLETALCKVSFRQVFSTAVSGKGFPKQQKDFIQSLRGGVTSISNTNLEDSIYGHMIVFAADQSMEERRPIDITI